MRTHITEITCNDGTQYRFERDNGAYMVRVFGPEKEEYVSVYAACVRQISLERKGAIVVRSTVTNRLRWI
jgi:hypothetical protein